MKDPLLPAYRSVNTIDEKFSARNPRRFAGFMLAGVPTVLFLIVLLTLMKLSPQSSTTIWIENYGWIVLVVLVSVIVLYYFGRLVFETKTAGSPENPSITGSSNG